MLTEPETPLEAYKAIIDGFVTETTHSVLASLVENEAVFVRNPVGDEVEINQFVGSLAPEQRGQLAAMLREERKGAIHDVLASLTWWILAHDVGLTFRNEPMPVEISGMGLHGDFIGRLQGDWNWPS
jgi:hypothetical protein